MVAKKEKNKQFLQTLVRVMPAFLIQQKGKKKMAYIGKVTLTSEWEKLEDLIKAQVDGQSAFAFDTSKEYGLQVDTARGPYICGAYCCNSTSEPAETDDGEHLEQDIFGVYQPDSGKYLWVKTRGSAAEVKLSVSEK